MITYLACPYSNNADGTPASKELREERFDWANKASAALILAEGKVVFSPISMTHHIDVELGMLDPEYWYRFDEEFMACCSECFVLMIPGWYESKGVKREIKHFVERDRPIKFIHIDEHGRMSW